MKKKYLFVAVMLLCIFVVSLGLTTIYVNNAKDNTHAEDKLVVVTSFYPMYIMAENILQEVDGVEVFNLSEPQTGCLHDFQLTPADMKLLSTADVFIVNGGGIESFLEDVAQEYPNLAILKATEHLSLLESGEHEHGEENAHAWMSVAAYRAQVAHIAEGLCELDAEHADDYLRNAKTYDEKLDKLEAQQESIRQSIAGEPVILFHEAYAYVAEDYGLEVCALMDLDEERQVSAGEVADVLSEIKRHGIRYILAEELYGSSMGQTLEKETDVQVIYLDTLNRGDYDADSYLEGMQQNIDLLREVFEVK